MGRLFGTDGVRGTYGAGLTDDLARSLGHAAATVLGPSPRILIGRDTRASGPALERALAAGVTAAGGEPVLAGIVPTAAVAYLVRDLGAAAGAVISASHNHARDNGIKFFGPDGMKLPDEREDAIESAMTEVPDGATTAPELEDADERYISFLLEGVPSLDALRVVVDCANGAASNLAPEVFRDAGAHVTALFCDPDGTNINDGCGSTHPEQLVKAVEAYGAHVGLALDGDADRLIAVDGYGQIVDGDQVLGALAIDAKGRRALPGDAVVTTVMANMGFRHAMSDAGIGLVETKVGDRYVLQAMREHGLGMGGEQSGHIVFLDRHTTGDGILTGLRLLGLLASSGRSLTETVKGIPRFPQVIVNVDVRDRSALDDAAAVWDTVAAVEQDLAGTGRVLVRASGTEDMVRVMVEAAEEHVARTSADRLADAVRSALT